MIRDATAADVHRLVEMGCRMIRETAYHKRLANNPRSLGNLMRNLIASPNASLRVSDQGGVVNGMIGACLYQHPLSGELVAGELFWWVEPECRGVGVKLLRDIERWADNHDAVRIQMIAPSDRVAHAYEMMGYQKLETAFQKDL